LNSLTLSHDIETAFGGEFLAFFRDQRDEVGLNGEGDLRHICVGRHFKVKLCADYFAKELKISVLDMTPIFPQMDDQAIGSCQFDQYCGRQRIWIGPSTCLPQRGHVVDIHTKARHPPTIIQSV
jgi:hypothetical protein